MKYTNETKQWLKLISLSRPDITVGEFARIMKCKKS